MDPSQSNGSQDTFVPFTKAERIEQLRVIDENIVSLLRTAARGMKSLSQKQNGSDTTMTDGDSAEVFKTAMNEFLRTLHGVNMQMKRQVWGLEEEGIVTLPVKKGGADDDQQQDKGKQQKTLGPDGDGLIGGLDASLLNSQSNKVERDMEAELWSQAEGFLRELLENGGEGSVMNMK